MISSITVVTPRPVPSVVPEKGELSLVPSSLTRANASLPVEPSVMRVKLPAEPFEYPSVIVQSDIVGLVVGLY